MDGVVTTLTENINEHLKDVVLDSTIPGGRKRVRHVSHGGHLKIAEFPRDNDRHEHVIALTRNVTPAHRSLFIHRERVSTDPKHAQRDIAHEFEAGGVSTGFGFFENLHASRRFAFEVAPDHSVELIETLNNGEVQLWNEV